MDLLGYAMWLDVLGLRGVFPAPEETQFAMRATSSQDSHIFSDTLLSVFTQAGELLRRLDEAFNGKRQEDTPRSKLLAQDKISSRAVRDAFKILSGDGDFTVETDANSSFHASTSNLR
jgi:hypothetical protein